MHNVWFGQEKEKSVKDESDDVQITVDLTLVNDDDKQTYAHKRGDVAAIAIWTFLPIRNSV